MAHPEFTPEHLRHLYEGEPDDDLIEGLEPDQLVVEMDRHLPQRHLSAAVLTGFWALRLLVLLISAAVVFVFVNGLLRASH
ncbi:MAG: hypothetical protein M3Y62_01815 [Candidatus Dormibacteraeota bacterium]|nr:hypothetical protein [Candidatus Dormibacteraeota bacterium]